MDRDDFGYQVGVLPISMFDEENEEEVSEEEEGK